LTSLSLKMNDETTLRFFHSPVLSETLVILF
jgi:hypothetical protein